jgi:hypothetical protein
MYKFVDSSASRKRDKSSCYTWKLLLLILFTAHCDTIIGNVEVYPDPGGSVQQSSMYQVDVIQDGVTYGSFVYEIHAQKIVPWRHNVCSFTTFCFTDPVTVEVTKLGGTLIHSCRIYPSSYKIPVEVVSTMKVAMTYEPLGWDWDLIVDYIDVSACFTADPSVEGFETGDGGDRKSRQGK